MKEFLDLGSSPIDEECAQVGSENYTDQARKECLAYMHQLQRLYPSLTFAVKAFPHDFGTYHEVVVFYDPDDLESSNNAYALESDLPYKWDEESKKELATN